MTPRGPFKIDRSSSGMFAGEASEVSVPDLVAEVFDAAPTEAKARLLEPLLRPLGLLSLFGVAGGIFARAKLNAGWPEPHVRTEDIVAVRAVDVRTLVAFAQQVSTEATDGIVAIMSMSAAYSGSAAAAVLAALVVNGKSVSAGESGYAEFEAAKP